MSTSLMFVVFACCCFGKASAAMANGETAVLTITYDATNVIYTCNVATGGFDDGADKLAITKDGGTVVFQTAAVLGSQYSFQTPNAKRTVPKASHTTADYGSYTCQMENAAANAKTTTSAAVVLPACSAAPRVVESLYLALVCVLATVLKSHM